MHSMMVLKMIVHNAQRDTLLQEVVLLLLTTVQVE